MLKVKAVKCGKPQCKKCPHEWFVYAQWKEKGKVKEKYLGKYGEAETSQKISELAKQHPRVINEFTKITADLNQLIAEREKNQEE